MTPSERPHRVTKPFFTFGTLTLLILMGTGFSFGVTRLFLGLGTVTNLDNHNPWGIWIAFDVACGVALAAGGFLTAALVEIFGNHRYRSLLRPALLTAFLGYLWVAIALLFDLGRYWNAWRPLVNWQGNSVLFEVGMCVSFYLVVLTVEMSPSILEGLEERMHEGGWGAAVLKRLERPVHAVHSWVRIVLPIFIVAGVVLSFMHQSSLGTLMLIAPTKTSSLWDTSILPVLFLLSALMVGFPMVILESIYANLVFGRRAEMNLLTPLAKTIPWFHRHLPGRETRRPRGPPRRDRHTREPRGDRVPGGGDPRRIGRTLHPAAQSRGAAFDRVAVLRGVTGDLRGHPEPDQRVPGGLSAALCRRAILPVGWRDRDDRCHRLEHPVLLPVAGDLLPDPPGIRPSNPRTAEAGT
jgi:formate-dependent nitrite reductase membrane component NrfD